MLVTGPAMAGPTGGRVIAGNARITVPDVNTTHIEQTSQRVFIDFDSYDVGADESVIYSQPSRSAIAVNRILDQKPSEILGSLRADGTIFLVNSRGIIFGENATVDVGALVASGLSISLDDFLKGEYRFEDASGGLVVNRGLIQAATGGSVALLGSSALNQGLIEADFGAVSMAAGSRAHLTFDADGLIGVEIDQAVTQKLPELEALVSNEGSISADGGRVVLSGATASGLFDSAVNNEGVIEAGRIEKHGGKVMLLGSGADVSVTGGVDVSARDGVSDGGAIRIESDGVSLVTDAALSARSDNGRGGEIQVLGEAVGLTGTTRVDASGGAGGGRIAVGGDFHGAGPLPNASRTLVGTDVSVLANALFDGDGGEIVVWSDDATVFRGALMARGAGSGAGGFAEISSPSALVSTGTYDLSAASGTVGTLLFDPDTITIAGGTADGSDDTALDTTLLHGANPEGTVGLTDTPAAFVIYESEIEGSSASQNIVLAARDGITASGDFAGDDLVVGNDLELTTRNQAGDGTTGVDLTTSADGGNLLLDVGGNLTVTTGTGGESAPVALPKVSAGGDQSITATGAVTIGDLDQANNTYLSIAAGGDVDVTASNGLDIALVGTSAGDVTLTTTAGNIRDDNDSDDVDATGTVTLVSAGSIGQRTGSRQIQITGSDLVLDTAGSFYVDAGGANLNSLSLTVDQAGVANQSDVVAGNIASLGISKSGSDVAFDLTVQSVPLALTFAADSGVLIGDVNTLGGSIAISANGAIDAAALDAAADLSGGMVALTSTNGSDIGVGTRLDVVSTSLSADGGNVTLDLTQDTDGTTLTDLQATGGLDLESSGDLLLGVLSAGTDLRVVSTNGGIRDLTVDSVVDLDAPGTITLGALTDIGAAGPGQAIDLPAGASVTAFAGGSINLAGLGSLTLDVSGGGNLTSLAVAGDLTLLSSAADINAPASVTVPGTLTVNASGNVSLTNPDNQFGTVLMSAGGDVDVYDVDGFVLGATNVGGDYNIVMFDAVNDAGPVVVGGTLSIDPNGNSVTLDEAGNDLGGLSVAETTDLSVIEGSDLALGSVQVTGDASFTLQGNLTDVAAIDIGGTLTVDAGASNVVLDEAANDFNVVNLTAGSATLVDANAISLQNIDLSGNLDVTANGNISSSTDLSVGALASFDSGADVILTGAGNDFGAVEVSSAQDVTLQDSNGIVLAGLDISGDLDLTAGGDVTDSATLLVAGNASFDTSGNINLNENANDFGSVQVLQGLDAFFVDVDDLTLSPSAVAGDLDIRADGAVTLQTSSVAGALDVRTAGLVNQNGPLVVVGNASFNTGGFDLTLSDPGNDFSSVSVLVAQDVVLNDADALVLDNVTANGNLTVSTKGALTDAGRVRALGTTSILAGAAGASADVTLDNAANDFGTLRLLRANAVSVADVSGIDLGSSAVDDTFALTVGGDVTSSGALAIGGQMSVVAGGNDVTLNDAGNDFASFSGDSIGNLTLNDVDGIVLEQTNVFGDFDLTASGTVDATGRITVGGIADLSAGGGSLVLDRVAHGFTEIRLSGDGASVLDDSALVLGTSDLASDLSVTTAGAITQSGSATVVGTAAFDAGGNDVRVNDPNNDFGTVTFNGADDVVLADLNDVVIGSSVIGGTFDVSAAGSISDANALSVGGLTTLSSGADIVFDGADDFSTLRIAAAANAVINDVNTLTLGASNVSGNFTLTTGDVLTSDQALSVGGLFAVDVGGTDLALTSAANDFGVLAVQAHDAMVVDSDDLTLGASTLSGDLTVASGGAVTDLGPISVAGTLGVDAQGNAVVLDQAGNAIVGAVSAANVSDLTLVNATDLLLADITLAGSLDLQATGDIRQAANTSLSVAGASDLTAVGGIDLAGANDLAGEVRLDTSGPIGDAFVRSADLTLGGSVVSGALAADAQSLGLAGNVTAASQDFSAAGPVTLTAGGVVTLQAAGDVSFASNPVDAADPNLDALSVVAGGNVALGSVGSTGVLQSLALTGSSITLGGDVATLGDQTFNGPVSLTAQSAAFSGAAAAFTGALAAPGTDASFDVDASFGGDVSLASLRASGSVTFTGGDVFTGGDQNYLGSIVLAAPDGETLLQGDNLTFAGAIASPIAGANALVLQAAGDVGFGSQAEVGAGGQALSRLDVAAAAISLGAARVETTAGQTYRNPFTLAADATLVNIGTGEVSFLDTLAGSGVESLLIDGNARFEGQVSALSSLTVTGTSTFNTSGISTAGAQVYGAGRLGNDVSLSASDLTFTGTVDSMTGQPGSALAVLLSGGTATFGGDVGAQERLGAISIDRDASFAGTVFTNDADVSVDGTTVLAGPVVSVNTGSGPGDITFGGIEGQGNDLLLTAGTGSVFLGGTSLDLNNLSIAGAVQVVAGEIDALGGVSITGVGTAVLDGSLQAQNLEVRVDDGYVQNADVTASDSGAVFIETDRGSLIMADATHIAGGDVSLVDRDASLGDTDAAIVVSQIAADEIRVGAAQGNILVAPVADGESNFAGTTLRIGGDTLVPSSPDAEPDFTSLAGDRFGLPDAPAVIDVSDLVVINSRIASQSIYLVTPQLLTENSLRELSLAQTLEAVGDTQRTTVVQLVLLDPAIFTAVSNVDSDEEPVRLPEDQRLD